MFVVDTCLATVTYKSRFFTRHTRVRCLRYNVITFSRTTKENIFVQCDELVTYNGSTETGWFPLNRSIHLEVSY